MSLQHIIVITIIVSIILPQLIVVQVTMDNSNSNYTNNNKHQFSENEPIIIRMLAMIVATSKNSSIEIKHPFLEDGSGHCTPSKLG